MYLFIKRVWFQLIKIMIKFAYKVECLYKQNAILYGNCHMNVIEECLNKSNSYSTNTLQFSSQAVGKISLYLNYIKP